MHTTSVSKQHPWNYFTQTHGVWTQVHGILYLTSPSREYPHILYILETTITGLHLDADNVGLSSLKFFWWAHKFCLFMQEWCLSRSMSSEVIDFGTNRKPICDFLLAHQSNLGHILHRFRDIAGFWAHDPTTIPPYYFGVFPLDQIAHVGISPRSLKLISREIIFGVF